jgi:hypothetical protein
LGYRGAREGEGEKKEEGRGRRQEDEDIYIDVLEDVNYVPNPQKNLDI